MPGDIDKINEIFKMNDDARSQRNKRDDQASWQRDGRPPRGERSEAQPKGKKPSKKAKAPKKAKERPAAEGEAQKKGKVVQRDNSYRSGCMGGIMYFVFIVCASVVLACVAWMAASDMLALNKKDFTAVVTLPSSIFQTKTVDKFDEDGNKVGTKRVSYADMDYVSDALYDAGLIQYKWLFNMFCKISTASETVSPGEYELKSSYDYRALIQNMQPESAAAVTIEVTFPEGFSMHQIFKRMEEKEVCSYDELMESAANDNFSYSFLEGLEKGDASRLEGFLFPDTYEFYVNMQASSAINKMLENFYYKLTAEMMSQAANMNMTMQQIVNVASLIEREAANDSERPVIASVIYNRIYSNMVIGIDAALLYEYPEHEGAPTLDMLQSDSPYNTRRFAGLPPTPICSPGMASIKAALSPASTDYYYYALDTATGAHKFFTNETEFNNFVATQDYS